MTHNAIKTLGNYDSATIANVLELFDIRSRLAGYMGSEIRPLYPELPPAVGYAVTATYRTSYPKRGEEAYASMPDLVSAIVKSPAPAMVVLQDLDEPPRAAAYGEMMAAAFKAFGCCGLIASGQGRDIQQVGKMRFPCFASGVNVSHGYFGLLEVNVPVHVGGLQVRPGDVLHADANGVVALPPLLLPEVAALCEEYVAAERVILDYCAAGKPTPDGYTQAAKAMHDRVKQLGEKASALVRGKLRQRF